MWNHLLKISSADSKGIIDNVMPPGSGKSVIDKRINEAALERTCDIDSCKPDRNSANASQEISASKLDLKSCSPQRPTSASRNGEKQAGWREARGPSKTGIGFNNVDRKEKNGQKAWLKLVSIKGGISAASYDLKAMLGLSETLSARKISNSSNASEGLKALIGVGIADEKELPSTKACSLESAADALMQLMMKDTIAPLPPPGVMLDQNVPFNFTYIKEGDDQSQTHHPSTPSGSLFYPQPPFHSIPESHKDYFPQPGQVQSLPHSSREQKPRHIMPSSTKKSSPIIPSVVFKSKK